MVYNDLQATFQKLKKGVASTVSSKVMRTLCKLQLKEASTNERKVITYQKYFDMLLVH